jgi:RNA polymerase sigma-70 factor, ECF subfamily
VQGNHRSGPFPREGSCRADEPGEEINIPFAEEICAGPIAPSHGFAKGHCASSLIPSAPLKRDRGTDRLDRASIAVPDSVLVERIMQRDERALAALYDRYAGMLYHLLQRILLDAATAEEVLQDLFLQVWRGPERFDPDRGSLAAWLVVIGRSRALSRLRVTRRRENFEVPAEIALETMRSPDDPEMKVVRLRTMERLLGALRALPPRQKEVVEMAYFRGMTQTEIASQTGSPLGTIKSRVRVAMQTLKALLNRETAQGGFG